MALSATPRRNEDEARLVADFRAGNELAFETIVARHRARLLAFARSILRSRPDAAEDVVQEALIRAHRALLRDDRPVALGPWLAKLTRNCALDEISRVKADMVSVDDSPAAQAVLVDRDTPSVVHERRATVRNMLEGIATLPDEQRHALLRREVDGASHADIASELGVTGAASRALVSRARDNLAKRDEALEARHADIQDELLRAYRTGRRASAHAYRHLAGCKTCRAYRGQLKAMRGALHALHPGGLLILSVAAAKAGLAGKGAFGAAAAAKSHAGIAAVAALTAVAAVGGVLVVNAGQPSPVAINSPAVPGHHIAKGAPVPAKTSIVIKTVDLSHGSASVNVTCGAGQRVADLLAPDAPGVSAVYDSATQAGRSRSATVNLSGERTGTVHVAVLCRVPAANGAITPQGVGPQTRGVSAGGATAVACVAHDFLRVTPNGGVIGSVGRAEPLRPLGSAAGWRKVQTQFGATGWLPAADLCG
jgi:RNA polymerase sigma factor (sigma-70 family)